MALSQVLSGGPSIPAGAQKISLKNLDTAATTAKEDVTDLSSSQREYADPPLRDKAANGVTATCSASGLLKGGVPEPSPPGVTTGWICTDTEVTYEVGKYATWSANWEYVEN